MRVDIVRNFGRENSGNKCTEKSRLRRIDMTRAIQMTCSICEVTYTDRRVNQLRRESLSVELDGRPLKVYVDVTSE
jgi:hypothetical protein